MQTLQKNDELAMTSKDVFMLASERLVLCGPLLIEEK